MSVETTPQPRTRVYLDHAASTPVHPDVAAQIADDLAHGLGAGASAASQHTSGRRVNALLAQARARLAGALGVSPHEVLFTSGGSEADGLAIVGRVLAARHAGVDHPHVLHSAIEHPAVSDSAAVATAMGATVEVIDVDRTGRVHPDDLAQAIQPGRTAVVSIMAANNETGVIADLPALVSAVRQATPAPRRGQPGWVAFHTDAVAALSTLAVPWEQWDLDLMSLSGHKLGAPCGVGALVARREIALLSPIGGGKQERGVRSGTVDVVGARALALAADLAVAQRESHAARLTDLRSRLLAGATALPGVHATLPDSTPGVPGIVHLWCEGADSEALLMDLDLAGIDASAGSACHAGVTQPSHVLLAMGMSETAARSTLRCSLGRETTAQDIDRLLAALPHALEVARRAGEVRQSARR